MSRDTLWDTEAAALLKDSVVVILMVFRKVH